MFFRLHPAMRWWTRTLTPFGSSRGRQSGIKRREIRLDPRSFIVAGSPYALPHLSWWYTVGREPAGVVPSNDWLYGVRDYGVSVWLYYLTNVASVDPAVISGVYAQNSNLTAQQYIFDAVGGDNLREMFADWAVQTAVGFDYLMNDQVDLLLEELEFFTTPEELHNNILELDGADANGSFSPDQPMTPGGWAYNSNQDQQQRSHHLHHRLAG